MSAMELAAKASEITNPVYRTHNMWVRVHIINARQVFDRVDFKITPVKGSGETWVAESMVTGSLDT